MGRQQSKWNAKDSRRSLLDGDDGDDDDDDDDDGAISAAAAAYGGKRKVKGCIGRQVSKWNVRQRLSLQSSRCCGC